MKFEEPFLDQKGKFYLLSDRKGSKFWKTDLIFEFAMVKIGQVPIFMKFGQPLYFIFGLFNPF